MSRLVCCVRVGTASLGGVFETALVEEGFDEGDDGALVVGGEIGGAAEAGEEAGGARGGDVVADRGEAEELVGGHAEGAGDVGEHRAGRLGVVGLIIGDDALRHAHSLTEGLLGNAAPFPDLGEAGPEAVAGAGLHRGAPADALQLVHIVTPPR